MRPIFLTLVTTILAGCYSPDLPPCAPDCDATLELVLDGRGILVVEPLDVECKSGRKGKACTFEAAVGLEVTVTAVEDDDDHRFSGWTTDPCDGQDEACVLVVESPATVVGARFTDDGDD